MKTNETINTDNKLEDLGIKLYTLQELEPVLQVKERTIKGYITDGRLKGVKIGGKWRVTEENLKNFLNGD